MIAGELMAQVVGFLASAMAFVLFVPQATRVWTSRHDARSLAGVSTLTQWLLLGNAGLWGVYAVLTGAFWVGAPGLINAPLAIVTLVLIERSRRRVADVPVGDCDFCVESVDHEVFVTCPPGWGSVMPCSESTRKNGVVVMNGADVARLRAERIPVAEH